MSTVHTGWRFRSGPTTDIGDVDYTVDLPLSPTSHTEEPVTDDIPRYGWVSAIGTIDEVPAEGTIVGPLEGVPGLPIAAPTGLALDGFTTGFPDLSWDEHPDATITGYKVYREEELIATIANPATVTYQDATVDPVTTYHYEIRAYRGARLSPAGDALEVNTPAVVPSAPTITDITPGDTELSVAFTAPASDGGAAITNYEYSTNNGSSFAAFSPADTTTPLEITGLTNGVEYEVIIRAVNSVGAGANSNMLEGTPEAAGGASLAYVQSGDGGNGNGSAAADSLPVAPTAGSLVLASYHPRAALDGAIGVPTAGSWTQLATVRRTGGSRVDIWGAIVPAGQEATYQTVTFPSVGASQHAVRIHEFSGTHQTIGTILNDDVEASTGAAGTSLGSGNVTTTEDDILLFGVLHTESATTARAPNGGFTDPAGAANAQWLTRSTDAYQIVSAQSNYAVGWTWTTSSQASTILLAIRAG